MRAGIAIIAAVLAIALAAWKLCYLPAGTPRKQPDLVMQWSEQLYLLDDDEVERFVPPPYPPQRLAYKQGPYKTSQIAFTISPQYPLHPLQLMPAFSKLSSETGTIGSATGWCHGISRVERDIPQALHDVVVDGDWVIRTGVLVERQMKAVASILSSVTGKQITIEYKPIEHEVIVVRGDWHFRAIDGLPPAQQNAVQVYADVLDAQLRPPATTTLSALFDRLSGAADLKVIDEVSNPPSTVSWTLSHSGAVAFESRAALAKVLENLHKQTSLQFTVVRRAVPVWVIRESATTQPAGPQ